jgi:excisionase family DNA binding protein
MRTAKRERVRIDTIATDEWVTPGPVASLFSVSVPTVSSWCKRGILPAIRLPGGTHYRILWADAVGLWERTRVSVAPGAYETKGQREARGRKAHDQFRAARRKLAAR